MPIYTKDHLSSHVNPIRTSRLAIACAPFRFFLQQGAGWGVSRDRVLDPSKPLATVLAGSP